MQHPARQKKQNDPTARLSRFLSLILRHHPEKIGLQLDAQGWADVDELLKKADTSGRRITREMLLQVVRDNDKQRFALNEDQTRIRASQGHSISIDLGLEPTVPPDVLYHGTVDRFLASIRDRGLVSGDRQHAHLSRDQATATKVGQRRGKPKILTVDSAGMHRDGMLFFLSVNHVWLTDHVPPNYIRFPALEPAD